MSYSDLYLTSSPKIISPADDSEPVATLFGIPFDSTHSYKPGCRFGPDVIRDAFNNIEIFMPEFGVDLEQVNIKDLGNLEHTVVAQNMIDMVRKTTYELKDTSNQLIILGGGCGYMSILGIPMFILSIALTESSRGVLPGQRYSITSTAKSRQTSAEDRSRKQGTQVASGKRNMRRRIGHWAAFERSRLFL